MGKFWHKYKAIAFGIICMLMSLEDAVAQIYIELQQQNGQPLANYPVQITTIPPSSIELILFTDSAGNVMLSKQHFAPNQKVIVSITGRYYQPIQDTVAPKGRYAYIMLPNFQQLKQTVVTGQYAPTITEESMHPVQIISSKKIECMAAVNLRDVLTNQTNVRLSQDAILGSSVSMMGVSGQNVKIMIDGVPVVGRLNGNIDLSQINVNDIDRIEIVKGPLSVKYGTNALAGTINIITKTHNRTKWFANQNSYIENAGTYNFDAAAGFSAKGHTFSLTGGRYFFDGWSPNDGFFPTFSAQRADSLRFKLWKPREQYFARLKYIYRFSGWNIGYKAELFLETITNRGKPQAPYQETAFDDYYKTQRINNTLFAKGAFATHYYLNIIAAYNHFKREKTTYIKDLTTLKQNLVANSSAQDTTIFKVWMSRGSVSYNNKNLWLNYEIGYDINIETGVGDRISGGQKTIGDYAFFGSAKIMPVKKFALQLGLRYGYNSAYKMPLTPSIHAKYSFGNFALRASYAKGFRSPTVKELYFYFVDINHNIVGNPNLLAENSNNFTFNLQYGNRIKKITLKPGIFAFYNQIENLITLAQNTGTEYTYLNIGNYTTFGGGLNFNFKAGNFSANVAGTVTGFSNQFSDTVAGIATYSFAPEARLNMSYTIPKAGFTASAFYKYQGQLPGFAINNSNKVVQTTIGDYHWLDVVLSQQFWKKRFTISTGVKNILNITNVSASTLGGGTHSSGTSNRLVARGRTVFIKLAFHISGKKSLKTKTTNATNTAM